MLPKIEKLRKMTIKQTFEKRNVNGILLLDKPIGMTSNDALQSVKHLFCARKAGHTGSLDPLASGMLPICFGEATKFSQFLLDSDKHYVTACKLGITTTTDDAEGKILTTATVPDLTQAKIENVLAQFRGNISQIPSMYSAIKHHGKPLYKLARQGIEIDRKSRNVTIYKLEILEQKPDTLTFDIMCSKGTYIRTLIADIGKKFNCGAHVIMLRRKDVGTYKEAQIISMEKIQAMKDKNNYESMDNLLLPIDSIFTGWNAVRLTQSAVYYLQQGQAVFIPNAPENGKIVLKTKDDTFIGIGEIIDNSKIIGYKLLSK